MNIATAYLERFAASSEMLRRVLMRRVNRAVREGLIEAEVAASRAEAVIARCLASGLVDDDVFAQGRAATLLRQGKAPGRIRQTLAAKGVAVEQVDSAMASLDRDHEDPRLSAAITLARKRRLGPFRPGDAEIRLAARNKDMAVLARAGHDFDTCRRVIDAPTPEALEDQL